MCSLALSLHDVTINVLTICCQIPGTSNLAFSLRDVTINAFSCVFCVFHIYFTLYVLLFVRDFEQLKGEGFFLILVASMFLNSWRSVHRRSGKRSLKLVNCRHGSVTEGSQTPHKACSNIANNNTI